MPGKKKTSNVNLSVAAKTLGQNDAEDDAFVRGVRGVKTSQRQDAKTSKRRMTVYLPEDLATEVEIACVRRRETVSGLIEDAVRALLGGSVLTS